MKDKIRKGHIQIVLCKPLSIFVYTDKNENNMTIEPPAGCNIRAGTGTVLQQILVTSRAVTAGLSRAGEVPLFNKGETR